MFLMKKIILLLSLVLIIPSLVAVGQDNTNVLYGDSESLFTYPQAPDTMTSYQDRANYVVIRFWNNLDLSKPIKNEVAFESAFVDYVEFFKLAHKTVVINSIKDFMNKAQSNKANFMLAAKVAERNLYSPQARFISDEAYMPFLEMLLASKHLKKDEKQYYKSQMEKINRNVVGAVCPELDVKTLEGENVKLSSLLGDKFTAVFFNDGECVDCMLDRLRLSTSVAINNMIANGDLKIVCVSPKEYSKEWAEEAKGWADNWTIVASDKAAEVFDLRMSPTLFFFDKDKKITDKNISVNAILN